MIIHDVPGVHFVEAVPLSVLLPREVVLPAQLLVPGQEWQERVHQLDRSQEVLLDQLSRDIVQPGHGGGGDPVGHLHRRLREEEQGSEVVLRTRDKRKKESRQNRLLIGQPAKHR